MYLGDYSSNQEERAFIYYCLPFPHVAVPVMSVFLLRVHHQKLQKKKCLHYPQNARQHFGANSTHNVSKYTDFGYIKYNNGSFSADFLRFCAFLGGRGEGKAVLQAIIRKSGGTAPLIFNLETTPRWEMSITPRPHSLGVPPFACSTCQHPAAVTFTLQPSRCASPSFSNFHRRNVAVMTAFVYTNTWSSSQSGSSYSGPLIARGCQLIAFRYDVLLNDASVCNVWQPEFLPLSLWFAVALIKFSTPLIRKCALSLFYTLYNYVQNCKTYRTKFNGLWRWERGEVCVCVRVCVCVCVCVYIYICI